MKRNVLEIARASVTIARGGIEVIVTSILCVAIIATTWALMRIIFRRKK